MQRNRKIAGGIARAVCGAFVAAALLAGGAQAASDSCREWSQEHLSWKAEVMRRYLTGAPQRELDAATFEMLQREAYLMSCDISVQGSRGALVGWRLVGRSPDDYASAVLEAVLEQAGFDVGLREQLGDAATAGAVPPEPIAREGLAGVAR